MNLYALLFFLVTSVTVDGLAVKSFSRCLWDEKYRAKYQHVLNGTYQYIGLDYAEIKSGHCGNSIEMVGKVVVHGWPFWSVIWYNDGAAGNDFGNFETRTDNWRALTTICSYGVFFDPATKMAACESKTHRGSHIPGSEPIIPLPPNKLVYKYILPSSQANFSPISSIWSVWSFWAT
jgi:hypothetical protein